MNSTELSEAFGYLSTDELAALKRYALLLPPSPTVINIGAGAGTSTLAFLESRDDLNVISVDIRADDNPLGSLYAEKMVVTKAGLLSRLQQIQGDSKRVAERWLSYPNTPSWYDMVFIDGDHSYKGCKGDILGWTFSLKPNGYMLVHDYNKGNSLHPFTGVWQAVDELLFGRDDLWQHKETVDSLVIFIRN